MRPLYTSLVAAKQALGGAAVPMTPLTDRARRLCNGQVPGMGVLIDDPVRGLRCPVRGCRTWSHYLGKHIAKMHRDIGFEILKDALGFRKTARFVSQTARHNGASEKTRQHLAAARSRIGPRRSSLGASVQTVEELNHRACCAEQLRAGLKRLAAELGRAPQQREFRRFMGNGHEAVIVRLFGSWRRFLVATGFEPLRNGDVAPTSESVLRALRAWHHARGRWPLASESMQAQIMRWPPLPTYRTARRVLGADSWAEVLSRAATNP